MNWVRPRQSSNPLLERAASPLLSSNNGGQTHLVDGPRDDDERT